MLEVTNLYEVLSLYGEADIAIGLAKDCALIGEHEDARHYIERAKAALAKLDGWDTTVHFERIESVLKLL